MRRWSMPRWWHYLHIGLGVFLLIMAGVLFVVFDPWNDAALMGFVAASVVYLLAGTGFGVDLGTRRLDGQRLAGVGTVLLGIAMTAIRVTDPARGTIGPASAVGVFVGLLVIGFGVGALYRPAVFGAAARDEAA